MTPKLFTVDARCARCHKKTECLVRVEVITTLTSLTNKLNTDPALAESPGEGIIILACDDFAIAAS